MLKHMSEPNSNDQSSDYRLYAVLVHVGSSMHSGHYFSYVTYVHRIIDGVKQMIQQ
jgi:uncharacterized UBP type Zn finger protein